MRRIAVVVLCVLALGACRSDKNDADEAADTTTTAAASVTTTTSTTVPSGPPQTPDAAAKGLFDAWQRGDKAGADRYAKPQPINELFSHPNTGDVTYRDQGCEVQGGQFECTWTYDGGALRMTVEAWPGGGFVVDDITYLVD
jgi:hypothetical protein